MTKIIINGQPLEVPNGTTVLKAAENAGIAIPHLCYHPAFPPEGSCRMCLVEIEGAPKLELACSVQVREGMTITTDSARVEEARRGVLECLLAEHPPDCPICDKAGECALQDYYGRYGLFEGRFYEEKEKKKKKRLIGKNLILDQERCILCTRCVRFLKNITGTGELGVMERGIRSVVDILDSNPVDNLYSGNLAEICPVGAITDRDFRFKTRSWFLCSGTSICTLCSRGCSIIIDAHKGFARFPTEKKVYRIRAGNNSEINGSWICDIGRYDYSRLNNGRQKEIWTSGGKGQAPEYASVLQILVDELKKQYFRNRADRIAVAGDFQLSNEELFLIKKIFRTDLGVKRLFFVEKEQGEGDDFLLTSERTPNKRGAWEIGFDAVPFELEDLTRETELLIIFGNGLENRFKESELASALTGVKKVFLLTPHEVSWRNACDFILPTALIAEKSGTITNVDGIVQNFQPAMKAGGQARQDWEVLLRLGKALDIDYGYFSKFSGLEDITDNMKKVIPFFEKKRA